MKVSKTHFVLNFVLFQLAWFACVLGGANNLALAGTLAVGFAVAVHLYLVPHFRAELALLASVALIGTAWDSIIVSVGLMSYPSGTFAPGIAPHWIIAMWVNFAVTLNVSMNWLKGRPLIGAVFGGVGGPLAYLTGYKLGGVTSPDLWLALTIQGLGWALILPLLLVLAERFDGVSPARGGSSLAAEATGGV